jgi:hypothetical protein
VASSQPFPKSFSKSEELLNPNGSVSDQVKNGAYSWVQVDYMLR